MATLPTMPVRMFGIAGWVVAALLAAWIGVRDSRRERSVPRLPEAPPPAAVARVGEAFLTADEVRAAIRRPGSADVRQVLDALVRRELLVQEAVRTGFADREDVRAAWRASLASRFEEFRAAERPSSVPVTEAEIARHYEAHRARYAAPERRRLALILLPSAGRPGAEERGALEDRAGRLRDQAVREASRTPDFGALAAEHSAHRPSRLAGGDVGWLTRAQAGRAWPAAVAEAAFALDGPGEVSPPLETGEGWYLVKLMERQPAEAPPLEQVRERVRYELTRERAAEAEAAGFAALRERIPVEVYEDRLEGILGAAVPAAAGAPSPQWVSRPPALPAP